MSNEEIAAIVAKSTEGLVGLTEQVKSVIEENARLTAENEALKNPKKQPVVLATEEELDAIYGALDKPTTASNKPKSELELKLDEIYGAL